MKFEIKSWWSGDVLFSLECGSMKLCIEAAVKSGADLSRADLSRANLSGADLSGADLSGANLSCANLSGVAAVVLARLRLCPSEGAFVAWKKLAGGHIAKLVIPHDAERMNSIGSRKCRASKAFVYEIFGAEKATDSHSGAITYKAGCEVIPDKFDPDIRVECSHGIHFFLTREEAEDY